MNNSGSLVLTTLVETGSIEDATRALAERFPGSTDTRVSADVNALVRGLVDAGLVVA